MSTDNKHESRQRAVVDALQAIVRQVQRTECEGEVELAPIELQLSLRLDPSNWSLSCPEPLNDQIARTLTAIHHEQVSHTSGRVTCFQCQSTHCEHALPPSLLDVFVGFSETGRPLWSHLVQALLDCRTDSVDRLYQGVPISTWIPGAELNKRVMKGFGKKSQVFAVLGQVIAGYYFVKLGEELERLALTFQWVRGPGGKQRVQMVMDPALRDEVMLQLPWIAPALKHAEKKINQSRFKGEAVMKRLASDVLRRPRRDKRSTKHAVARRHDQRPVDKAIADALEASCEKAYLDLKSNTLAIRGRSGRCHIFNQDGQHVTSFSIESDAVQSRLNRKRWQALPKSQFLDFQSRLRASLQSG
ncbi:MAG: hypothetical protein KDC35_17255 [Acidobacteria bacterium]|nr:hypothetical protein [Acidobacteriota bacterium]